MTKRPSGIGTKCIPIEFVNRSSVAGRELDKDGGPSSLGADATGLVVEAKDAIVTIRGRAANATAHEQIERAARTVQGIKRLELELE